VSDLDSEELDAHQ